MKGKRYRVIVHVSHIEDDVAVGYIFQWHAGKHVRFPASRIPKPWPKDPQPWMFIGMAKIGEDRMEDLDVEIEERAPDPDATDGLA